MKNLIIDNWSIENITKSMIDNPIVYNHNTELYDFIESILLWDNIYYIKNEYSVFWENVADQTGLANIISPQDIGEEEYIIEAKKYQYLNKYSSKFVDVISQGAIEYLMLCNYCGYDYLPCAKRAYFIEQNKKLLFDSHTEISNAFAHNRHNIFKNINAFVNKYRYDSNLGSPLSIPAISQYIIDQSKGKKIREVIEAALKMRDNYDVRHLRTDLNRLYYMDDNTIYKIKRQIYNDIESMKSNLNILSSIKFNLFALANLSLEICIPIELKRSNNIINNVFLKKVIRNVM